MLIREGFGAFLSVSSVEFRVYFPEITEEWYLVLSVTEFFYILHKPLSRIYLDRT